MTGALLIGAGPTIRNALAAPPQAAPVPFWWFHGELEAGGRMFLNNPNRNGINSAGQNSLAKYYEYSTIKPGTFLDGHVATGSNDGLYQVDIWAKNVGYSDQRFNVDASQAGQHYFNFEWDQTPHLYSTSAQTLYNGVGTNALTLPAGLGTQLYNAAGGAAAGTNLTAAQANAVKTIINNNVHQTDIGIRRDTGSVDYSWTPTDAWRLNANYSHLHRTGTQIDGVVMSPGTGTVRVDAVKPVDDTTQNFGLNGEYAGTSPWSQKFNFKLGYNGSVYTDASDSYTVQNPFCQDSGGLSACQQGAANGNTSSYKTNQMPLWPSNRADAVMATLGADLPAKSRYMGTASYNMMRQDQNFLPWTINPTTPVGWLGGGNPSLTSSLPASGLGGAINTLMLNNVVTTQITPDLKSKLMYRYYDYNNDTPELRLNDWVINDFRSGGSRSADYAPAVGVQRSYTKQNAGADLNWHPTRQWNFGVGYGYEHYNWTRADADVTNENSGKVYADWKPASWMITRASYMYSARRYENYDNYNNLSHIMWPNDLVGVAVMQNQSYRQLMYSDRDRNQAKFSTSIDVAQNLTITPTAGLQYDNYLNNVSLGSLTTACAGPDCVGKGTYNGVPLNGTQPGLKHNNAWNWGLEGSYVFTPDTTLMLAYMREYRDQEILWCGNGAPSPLSGTTSAATAGSCNAFSNSNTTGTGFPSGSNDASMKDTVDTFMAKVRYAAIPNKLDFDFGYTLSIANSTTSINPGPFASYSSGPVPAAGVITVAGGPFPDTKTTFQRFDVMSKYKLDDDLVQRLGYKGEIAVKLRYAYERTSVTNWQNDSIQSYMWSTNNQTLGYMTWLAGNNPNYNVHLLAASLVVKW
jgi:MtrB/PioB family decaheme-associated outer membrane protein